MFQASLAIILEGTAKIETYLLCFKIYHVYFCNLKF